MIKTYFPLCLYSPATKLLRLHILSDSSTKTRIWYQVWWSPHLCFLLINWRLHYMQLCKHNSENSFQWRQSAHDTFSFRLSAKTDFSARCFFLNLQRQAVGWEHVHVRNRKNSASVWTAWSMNILLEIIISAADYGKTKPKSRQLIIAFLRLSFAWLPSVGHFITVPF